MLRTTWMLASMVLLVGGGEQASAGIMGVAGGSGDPAATLGGYAMTPFAPDLRPAGSVSSVPSPLSGSVNFSSPVGHIPSVALWGDPWGNSYTGDVYHNVSGAPLTLTL